MKNKIINERIVKLWNKHFPDADAVYAPLFYDTFKKDTIAFVGMNPSFSASAFRTFLKGTPHEKITPTEFFKWSNIKPHPDRIDESIAIDSCALEKYTLYFKRPNEISKLLGVAAQHLDLFLYRETSQTNFLNRIKDKDGLTEFALDQLNLFREVLTKVNPRCVVFSNAYGSELVRDYFKDDLKWDEKKGFHWFTLSGTKVPTFFTSMLSGQRSLDRWSYERLVWQIKKALK